MKTHKRYMAIVTALVLIASLPLGAMKRKNNPVTPSNETEEKKIKITPKIEKISGFLGEKFYESMELIKKVGIILNTTYEKEKNTPIKKLPENSLRQTLKKNDLSEKIFLQQLKTYFSDDAIQFFISWCETTRASKENDKLFENVINYVLEHQSTKDSSIYNQIKEIFDKEKISYPITKEFDKTCTEQDPEKRYADWLYYKKENTFHSDTITISDFSKLKECINTTAQDMGAEIKSIEINNCYSIDAHSESKSLRFDINEILSCYYTDDEIKAILQHECTHLKNNDSEKITKIITLFLSSASKENLLLLINDENSIQLIQQNTTFIYQFHEKIQELFADKGTYDKNNMNYRITSLAKRFILYATISKQSDPSPFVTTILECDSHLPLKKRIVFWAKKDVCFWNAFNNTNQNKNTKFSINTVFQEKQEYSSFAINSLLIMDFIKTFKENNTINISQYPLNDNERLTVLKGAFTYTLERNHLDIIQNFLKPENVKILEKTNKYFLDSAIRWAINSIKSVFKKACKNRNMMVIREFCKPENSALLQKITTTDLCQTFVNAAINGDKDIVAEFFKQENKNVLEKITNYTFKESTINMFLNDIYLHATYSVILNLLEFKLGDYIDTKDLNESLRKMESTSSNYEKIINFLFMPENRISLHKIDAATLGNVLQKAIHDNNLKIVNKFFDTENNEVLKRTSLDSSLQDSLENQKIDILKLFFKHGKGILTLYHMGMIIAAAKPNKIEPGRTQEGYKKILSELLFKEGHCALFEGINFGKRLYAGPKPIKVVKKAIKYGASPKTLQIILDNNTIKQKDLKKALEKAETEEIKETINKYIKE